MIIPLTPEQLRQLKFPIPDSYSAVFDSITALIVDAPEFSSKFFPSYNIEVAYSMALLGLQQLRQAATSDEQRIAIDRCSRELLVSYGHFKTNEADDGFSILQAARESAKEIRRKRARHQPLPHEFE
jgi:hypothetical protein